MPGLDGPAGGIATLLRRLAFRHTVPKNATSRRSSRRFHHCKDFVSEGGNTLKRWRARTIISRGYWTTIRFTSAEDSRGKCDIVFRGAAGMQENIQRGCGLLRRYCRHSARSPSRHSVVRDRPASAPTLSVSGARKTDKTRCA